MDREIDSLVAAHARRLMSPRKNMIRRLSDDFSADRERWLKRAAFFHSEDLRYLRFLIPEGLRVLELGCGTGHLLAALKPSFGLGVDFSEGMIAQARKAYPHLSFQVGRCRGSGFIGTLPGPFDVILIADTIGLIDDCQSLLVSLHTSVHARDQARHRLFLPSLVPSIENGGSGRVAHAAAFFLRTSCRQMICGRSSNLLISNQSRARSGCSPR